MKNTCPKCDTAYNVSASVIGRKFTCKNCSTPVIVTAEGLDYQNPPAAAPAALPAPAAVPATAEAAFDFDAGGGGEEEERKPAKAGKAAKAAKPAKRPAREEEPEVEEEEDRPIRPAKRRASGGGGGDMGEYLAFRKFLAPIVIKIIFWLLVLAIAGGGVVFAIISAIAGGLMGVLTGAAIVFIAVPLYILMVRIYCELVLLAFNIYDRLGDIKTLLEKSNTPPQPPTP